MKRSNVYRFLIVFAFAAIVYASLNQSGVKDLRGTYREVTFYQNENNTGLVERIFVVAVKDYLESEFQDYGDLMPHSKLGTTTVYFFDENGLIPEKVQPKKPHFGEQFNANCLAVYVKNNMGFTTLMRYPFKSEERSAHGF